MLRPHRRISALLLGTGLLLGLLSGCGPIVTYTDVRQTAQAGGCWPNRPAYPTPPPVTITPPVPLTPTPIGWRWPTTLPAPTRLPTTTPYPRCAAAAGDVLEPWPTPLPAPPPFPTMEETRSGGGSGQKQTLQLPETILHVDSTTHPTEGWPAVAASVWSGNDNPERAFVSVLNPATRTWTPAHQVDIGPAALGRYTRTIEVAITGDGVVHAVWGMSDPDFSDNDPPSGVWAAESRDYGASWSQPQRIGTDCRKVVDVAASLGGWLVAGLICTMSETRVQAAIALRSPAGVWSIERLQAPLWSFSDGAVAIADDTPGVTPSATVLFLTGPNGAMVAPPRLLLYRKALGGADPWRPAVRDLVVAGGEAGPRIWHARAVVYRPSGAAQDSVTFTWSDATRWRVYAMTSQDAGTSWLPPEVVVAPDVGDEQIAFAAPAYDAATNRLLAVWTCCVEGGWSDAAPGTHYVSSSAPGSGRWQSSATGRRIPLVSGARATGMTVSAQARNARQVWLAWIEGGKSLEVRAIDLVTVLPRGGQP